MVQGLGRQLFPRLGDSTVQLSLFHSISANHRPYCAGLDVPMSTLLGNPRLQPSKDCQRNQFVKVFA